MDIFHLNDKHSDQLPLSNVGMSNNILLLPSISTQACPIIAVRENSTLTKRMSYSDNLKERTIQSPKPSCVVEGLLLENSESISKSKVNNLKGKRCLSDPSSSISILRQNSLKECHQILSRIQKKLSNKSVKKSSSLINKSSSESKSWCVLSHSRKKKISAASLSKNDSRRKNSSNKKKLNMDTVEVENKKSESSIIRNKELENIYVGASKERNPLPKRSQKTLHKLTMVDKEKDKAQKHQQKEKTVMKANITEKDIENVNKQFADIMLQKSLTKEKNKLRNIYYSEKQSEMVDNIPGVPPCTPNERFFNAIASLSDVRSQRCIQQKLGHIKSKQKKKEKEILEAAKAKELQRKLQKRKELMDTQRRQIYAINKVLADIEYEKFLKFKDETQGVPI